jgi:hypothetical protein
MTFRFSLRGLLWLTLVVAMALTWWIREHELRAKIAQARAEAKMWRGAAGALEQVLKQEGWDVHWNLASSLVTVSKMSPFGSLSVTEYSVTDHEPSD